MEEPSEASKRRADPSRDDPFMSKAPRMLTTVDGVGVVLNDPDRPPTLKPFVVQRYRRESDKDPPVVGDALAASRDDPDISKDAAMPTTVEGVGVALNDPDRPPTPKPPAELCTRRESDKDLPVASDALAAVTLAGPPSFSIGEWYSSGMRLMEKLPPALLFEDDMRAMLKAFETRDQSRGTIPIFTEQFYDTVDILLPKVILLVHYPDELYLSQPTHADGYRTLCAKLSARVRGHEYSPDGSLLENCKGLLNHCLFSSTGLSSSESTTAGRCLLVGRPLLAPLL